MEKTEALILLKQHITSPSLLGHCLSTAAVMKGLATELGEDAVLWETIGILHDIDFEEIHEDMEKHGIIGYEILWLAGVGDEIALPIKRHNHMIFGSDYTTPVEICLQVADSVSGLIVACAHVKGGNITDVSVKTVTKKYKTPSFAAGCDRKRIALGDALIPRERMYEIAINEITAIKDELGLN
ncbi:MAG: HDIG domain-containing protein [Methanocorpusculum sp.]|uniref:HDIG domain-containing metalloprotein n=1 Tax=Methanocorpusculum sp. TaxID=2058474 RepID=UPI0027189F32|nr:HDIG domain-containing metalloprotein [Methanocorpusculum sp.]MDO9522261.1 HDIG domain-containing protein [Methanocorpusculum sp.]